jgi:hypothetical protein
MTYISPSLEKGRFEEKRAFTPHSNPLPQGERGVYIIPLYPLYPPLEKRDLMLKGLGFS